MENLDNIMYSTITEKYELFYLSSDGKVEKFAPEIVERVSEGCNGYVAGAWREWEDIPSIRQDVMLDDVRNSNNRVRIWAQVPAQIAHVRAYKISRCGRRKILAEPGAEVFFSNLYDTELRVLTDFYGRGCGAIQQGSTV